MTKVTILLIVFLNALTISYKFYDILISTLITTIYMAVILKIMPLIWGFNHKIFHIIIIWLFSSPVIFLSLQYIDWSEIDELIGFKLVPKMECFLIIYLPVMVQILLFINQYAFLKLEIYNYDNSRRTI